MLPFPFSLFTQVRNTVLISEYLLIFSSTTIHPSYTISPTHTQAHTHTYTHLSLKAYFKKKNASPVFLTYVDFYSLCCFISDS